MVKEASVTYFESMAIQIELEQREVVLNAIAFEAERRVGWQKHADQLMTDYNITVADVEQYIQRNGPFIKFPHLKRRDTTSLVILQFMRTVRLERKIPFEQRIFKSTRHGDDQEEAFPGARELTLKFALSKNIFGRSFYFIKLVH
jgi:hypothetical protein